MTMRLTALIALLLLTIGSGCSGENDSTATQPPATTSPTASSEATLKRAVRKALEDNRRLSIFVLANNRIPAWATRSTQGPALDALQAAASNRKKRGIRIRLISDQFRVVSIRLNPSYRTATALARARQRVRPYARNGEPSGPAVKLDERVRVELRRLGTAERFVVWRVNIVR